MEKAEEIFDIDALEDFSNRSLLDETSLPKRFTRLYESLISYADAVDAKKLTNDCTQKNSEYPAVIYEINGLKFAIFYYTSDTTLNHKEKMKIGIHINKFYEEATQLTKEGIICVYPLALHSPIIGSSVLKNSLSFFKNYIPATLSNAANELIDNGRNHASVLIQTSDSFTLFDPKNPLGVFDYNGLEEYAKLFGKQINYLKQYPQHYSDFDSCGYYCADFSMQIMQLIAESKSLKDFEAKLKTFKYQEPIKDNANLPSTLKKQLWVISNLFELNDRTKKIILQNQETKKSEDPEEYDEIPNEFAKFDKTVMLENILNNTKKQLDENCDRGFSLHNVDFSDSD